MMKKYLLIFTLMITFIYANGGVSLEKLFEEHFGKGVGVGQKTVTLSPVQIKTVQIQAKAKLESKKTRLYYVKKSGVLIGYGVILVQTVRTKKAVILYLVDKDVKLRGIEIIAFKEPSEYKPNSSWYSTFEGKGLGDNLIAGHGIPLISGATMSARTISDASRLALAIVNMFKEK